MISILVPIYNAENCIKRCLDSILGQTYRDLEIVLINDGSKDNSLSIIQGYSKRDKRIKIINQENQGVASARNTALRNATGEAILYVDADDWIEPEMIEKMCSLMDKNIDIVFCGSDHAEEKKTVKRVSDIRYEVWSQEEQQQEFMLHQKMTGMLWNKLIRRSLTEEVYFDERVGYGEDAQFLWKILKKSKKMIVTNEILYHHVLDENSISHQTFNEKKYTAIPMWEEITQEVKRDYPKYVKLAKERLMSAAVFSCYEIKKSHYKNEEQEQHLKKIVRENLWEFVKSDNISCKMKLYAIAVSLGV